MTALCRREDLDRTGAKGITLGDGRDIVVVKTGDGVRGYLNSCPHQGVPLEMFADRFLDAEGTHLVCTAHGARFRVNDGVCVWGPCVGKTLQRFAIELRDGMIETAGP